MIFSDAARTCPPNQFPLRSTATSLPRCPGSAVYQRLRQGLWLPLLRAYLSRRDRTFRFHERVTLSVLSLLFLFLSFISCPGGVWLVIYDVFRLVSAFRPLSFIRHFHLTYRAFVHRFPGRLDRHRDAIHRFNFHQFPGINARTSGLIVVLRLFLR